MDMLASILQNRDMSNGDMSNGATEELSQDTPLASIASNMNAHSPPVAPGAPVIDHVSVSSNTKKQTKNNSVAKNNEKCAYWSAKGKEHIFNNVFLPLAVKILLS
uniref:Uncharacterized protein n=1 Tax=Corethron hystrix TaxID=216773 RepID=A0A7S1BYE0_9STRA|mmetsp:Transcript_682/g.1374  ORF Transcript_682/g.1374 Transcript_682/m.1374 type:complete len:105 (+) Transcript_682:597-911(+)